MNYVTELLEEQKELLTEEMRFAEGEELEQTKQRMTDVVDALNKLSIHVVGNCPFEAYAVFCIECDRKGIKPIKHKDYLNLG